MIQLRYRRFEFDDWTDVTLDGDDEELGFHIFGTWIVERGHWAEVLDEDGEWVPLVEEGED